MKVIRTEPDYETALKEVEGLVDLDPKPGTEEGDRLEVLALLISVYEEDQYPLGMPDPVEAIKFRMEQQGLTQRDLIPYLGSRSRISEVLGGKRPLTLKMIRALHKGLGIPAEVLVQDPGGSIPKEIPDIDWLKFPIHEMVKRGWFRGFKGTSSEARTRAEELLRSFFSTAGAGTLQPAMYRQNVRTGSEMNPYSLMAWRARVIDVAQRSPLPTKYTRKIITKKFMTDLVGLSYFDDGPKLAKEFLEKNGIHLVAQSHLPKTHLDGSAMFLEKGAPVVALTLRHDRLDNFWFCLCHELAHVALHLEEGGDDCFFDDFNEKKGNELEEEADRFARDALIPPKVWANARIRDSHTPIAVMEFAGDRRINPAIVAGRIRWEKNNYRILTRMLGRDEVRIHFPEYH